MESDSERAIEEAINRLSKVAHIPEENIKFYLDLYRKIDLAETDSRYLINMFEDINESQYKLLKKAVTSGWLRELEASLLWQLWQYFLNKEQNTRKFSVKALPYINFTIHEGDGPKKGRRPNLGIDFLFMSLKKDAVTFGKRPHYSEISGLLSSLKGEDRYAEPTLRGKKINPFVVNNTLTLCKAYFDAKGEPFLPDPLPTDPKGQVRNILQVLGLIPEDMPKKSSGKSIPSR